MVQMASENVKEMNHNINQLNRMSTTNEDTSLNADSKL